MKWKFWEKEGGAAEAPGGAPPDEKALRSQLSKVLKSSKGPAVMRMAKELMERMKKEGVDVKDQSAVRAWIEKNRAGLEKEEEASRVAPFVHAEAQVGRNDPCRCGSGKKFKKCCGAKA